MSFWVAALALLAAAVAVLVRALVRPAAEPAVRSRAETVTALYEDRLRELDQEQAGGVLASEDRAAVEEELGRALLEDYVEETQSPARGRSHASVPGALAAALLLVVLSSAVYVLIGDPAAEALKGAEVVMRLDPDSERDALDAWALRLGDRVADKPEDAKSWYLLGHTRLKQSEFQAAAEAFATAHAIVGPDPGLDVYWLQARYLAAGGVLDATSRGIAERILAREPNHLLVLEIFAIDAFRAGDYARAVGHLDRALAWASTPAQRDALEAGLERARAELGELVPGIDVQVVLETPPPAGAVLFVIARPPGGGMPFAVVRRPAVAQLRSLRLDDAVSMNPALPLSAASEIEVVVRLSIGGTPVAQPGDWEWRSETIPLAGTDSVLTLEASLAPP